MNDGTGSGNHPVAEFVEAAERIAYSLDMDDREIRAGLVKLADKARQEQSIAARGVAKVASEVLPIDWQPVNPTKWLSDIDQEIRRGIEADRLWLEWASVRQTDPEQADAIELTILLERGARMARGLAA